MKKSLQILLVLIFSIKSFAQLDREHWFAPMFDGQSNHADYEQVLHLSTNETTPFLVSIYNNNTLLKQVSISKGSPGIIDINRNDIIADSNQDLNVVGRRGLYIKGEKPFFANLRFGVQNHAEIITSKGTAGIGKDFYTVMAPNLQNTSNLGSSVSVLATENNTNVTINNFKKNISFNNYGATAGFSFTLNKGESFIVDVRSTNINNRDGFIGAKITSDKPISISNGNFNGQYASTATNAGSDILMDQSVPVDKLGNEFVIVKGYGLMGNKMEGAIVVATEKNTSIYLNDDTTPIAVLANEGDYFKIEETEYQDRGNSHYNLHVSTDKNVYVYQLLGGVETSSAPLATGGMNYIPPLNCYLPRKIDEISYINKIEASDADDRFVTKLNIITEKDATIKVNGIIPDAKYGPYDVSNIIANQKWVTYSIPNVKGNITVESNKAVTAGIASGNNAFGYGGYFAGFSSTPLILKTFGECLPGVKLEVTQGFDMYQWEIKNAAGVFVNAPVYSGLDPATNLPYKNNEYTFYPPQAGIYRVRIKQGSCPEIITAEYKFYNCTTYTNANYETCTTQNVVPVFSLSSQSVNPPTVKIEEQPSNGTVVVNNDGSITYTANSTFAGIDKFKYSYCGNNPLPDCEVAQATITINQIIAQDALLKECSSTSSAVYNLSLANVTANSVTKTYYTSKNGAENEIAAEKINNYTAYSSQDTTVFVRLENAKHCISIKQIELRHNPNPVVTENLYTKVHCDEDDGIVDGNYIVDPNDITPIILANSSAFSVKYYDTKAKADAGGSNNITASYPFTTSKNKIWIRVESTEACLTIKEITLAIGAKITLISNSVTESVCDNDLDGKLLVKNLSSTYRSYFTNDTTATVKFYIKKADAQNNASNNIDELNVSNQSTLYAHISSPTSCADVAELILKIKVPQKSSVLADKTICPSDVTYLDAGSGFKSYEWYKKDEPSNIIGNQEIIEDLPVGKYFVVLTGFAPNDCPFKQAVEIKPTELPVIESIEITGKTVKITAKGGTKPYQYAIDNGSYQDSNVFTNIPEGIHTAYVISADKCDPVAKEFSIIEIYNIITPNGDGKNDVFDMSLLKLKQNVKFQIFNRSGQKLFEGNESNHFTWDGKQNGKPLPTSSYWYILQWQDFENSPPVNYSGWILLKNRNSD